MAELLFAIEAALPFVEAEVGSKMCSSSGSPEALKKILKKYDWDKERWITSESRRISKQKKSLMIEIGYLEGCISKIQAGDVVPYFGIYALENMVTSMRSHLKTLE